MPEQRQPLTYNEVEAASSAQMKAWIRDGRGEEIDLLYEQHKQSAEHAQEVQRRTDLVRKTQRSGMSQRQRLEDSAARENFVQAADEEAARQNQPIREYEQAVQQAFEQNRKLIEAGELDDSVLKEFGFVKHSHLITQKMIVDAFNEFMASEPCLNRADKVHLHAVKAFLERNSLPEDEVTNWQKAFQLLLDYDLIKAKPEPQPAPAVEQYRAEIPPELKAKAEEVERETYNRKIVLRGFATHDARGRTVVRDLTMREVDNELSADDYRRAMKALGQPVLTPTQVLNEHFLRQHEQIRRQAYGR